MENVRAQEKLEASLSSALRTARGVPTGQGKMLENGDESNLSSNAFLGVLLELEYDQPVL